MGEGWVVADAPAKVNLALVVGPARADGLHEVATVLQRIDLADTVAVRRAERITVTGFEADTIVHAALEALRALAGASLEARVEKRIPVAAGLGGGSSDAATALRLGNELLGHSLDTDRLHEAAARLGSDVPFFLRDGPQLATGSGTELAPIALPEGFPVVLVVPHDVAKVSTGAVYRAFDERGGERGFAERAGALRRMLGAVGQLEDLARLPPNDLASSPLSTRLAALGALRADVSGAGPTVYGVFSDETTAIAAARALDDAGQTFVTRTRSRR
jgi:4-diphosphocytidyl-2-C-methyl-D-erythritol kinase